MYNIEMLLKNMEQQNTAFFIGAGAARCDLIPNHQLPDGNEMKLKLYEHRYGSIEKQTLQETLQEYEERFKKKFKEYEERFKKDFKIKKTYISPEVVWEKCLTQSGEDLTPYLKLLEDMFGEGKYISPNYKFMAWLNLMEEKGRINQIITTNFDEKIEDAYKLLKSRGLFTNISVFTAADDNDFTHFSNKLKDTRIIYKLHGTISRPFTIKSSLTDVNKNLSEWKYNALKKIFESNTLIVFVGYACNDKDIFNALKKISNEVRNIQIVWVKKSSIQPNSNIYEILGAFKSTNNVIYSNSYDFFKNLFNEFVKREEINISLIKPHVTFMKDIVIKDTTDLVNIVEKEPISDVLYKEKIFSNFFSKDFTKDFRESVFKIINSFDMQRLRDIRQLSFAQYIYPSATHTRFSHSLGVAYLVSRALTNSNLKNEIKDDEDRKNTIYAALLHDIGHGPLGHVLDKFYDRLQIKNEHEQFTKKFIDEGLIDLREVLKDVDVKITEVKNRTVFNSKNGEELMKYADKLYLAWLITDYALDLDRIDFLMRDLLMTQYKCQSKLPIKLQQDLLIQKHLWREVLNDIIDDFISRLCVGTRDELDETYQKKFPKNVKILYINNKGEYNLEELLRFLLEVYIEMYSNVYYHNRITCAEAMMAKALHIAYDTGDIDRSRLYTFTDSELYAYLENLENDLIREIVYSVKHRRFFRPVVQFDLNLPENISAVNIEEEIAKKFELDQNDFKSMVIVNIPRKKHFKNLYIKKEGKIVPYPNLSQFEEKLSASIKGKIFIHPKNKLYTNPKEKQILVNLLKDNGILSAEVVSNDVIKKPRRVTLNDFNKM